MLCNDIYERALTMIGETPDSQGISDYSTRADYLLPGVIAQLANFSDALGVSVDRSSGLLEKTADFPLAPSLATAAAKLLASFLIAPEDSDYAELLAEEASASCRSFAASIEGTKDIYGF